MWCHVTQQIEEPRPLFSFTLFLGMADLFENSGSGDEAADSLSPKETPTPATNGLSGPVDPSPLESPKENGLEGGGGGEKEEEDGEYTEKGPRDDIKVSVLRYQRTADDFTFDVEVCPVCRVGVGLR